ncbi:Ecm1p [Saccharomyces cerevisiae FostersB]|nr:Ecm1p [Saccharomyces cerevisiae FostersB]
MRHCWKQRYLRKPIKVRRGKKLNKKALEDKLANSISSMDRDRLVKALNFTNRLDGKIAKSISRAKYIQNTRKAGWDSTNETIKKRAGFFERRVVCAGKKCW